MANYLVGVTISARMYPTAAAWKYLCIIGSTKAAVLPEPVIELATTSLPDKMTGMAIIWIGVGFTYPTSLTAFSKGRISLRSSNDFCFCCLFFSLLSFCFEFPSIKIFSYAISYPFSFSKDYRFYLIAPVFYIFCWRVVWLTFCSD